ncbi:MAG: hypothetical protein MSA09_13490 [Lachnospiraceae bacterium]|nr:hypothetical protein [Lachnospiraceae bacterium]MDD7035810.1 hypothetical protein [Bacillota bacterium]
MKEQVKIKFSGRIRSVQPRANVWRYRVDNRSHSTTGYNIFLTGVADGEEGDFAVAISQKQQEKLRFHIGDEISGTAWTKKYPKCEYADFYRAGALKKLNAAELPEEEEGMPWTGEVPELAVYDWLGCRMLDTRRYKSKCFTCKWACMANVAIEYDWGVSQRFRFESFCYGPKTCKLYNMGKPRAVPYKDSPSSYDEGWLDEYCTEARGDDEEELYRNVEMLLEEVARAAEDSSMDYRGRQ